VEFAIDRTSASIAPAILEKTAVKRHCAIEPWAAIASPYRTQKHQKTQKQTLKERHWVKYDLAKA